jgi:hypothetical protein
MRLKVEIVKYAVNSAGQCVRFSNYSKDNEKKGIKEIILTNVDIEFLSDQIKVYAENELYFSMPKKITAVKPGFLSRGGTCVHFYASNLTHKEDPYTRLLGVHFYKKTNKLAMAELKSFMGRRYKKFMKGVWDLKG